MSESHSASPLVADLAYGAFVLVCLGWLVLLVVVHRAVAADAEEEAMRRREVPGPRRSGVVRRRKALG